MVLQADSSLQSELCLVLDRVEKPILFALRQSGRSLSRVKNLETTLKSQIGHAIEHACGHETYGSNLKALLACVPDANGTSEQRLSGLRDCLKWVEVIRGKLRSDEGHSASVIASQTNAEPKIKTLSTLSNTASSRRVSGGGALSQGRKPKTSLEPSTAVQYLPGVGPKTAEHLATRNIETVDALLRFLPRRYEHRERVPSIAEIREGVTATVEGEVHSVAEQRFRGRSRLTVALTDGTGTLWLVWFRYPYHQFRERFEKGTFLRVSGAVKRFKGRRQIVHPEVSFDATMQGEEAFAQESSLVPAYLDVETIKPTRFRKIMKTALEIVDLIPESLPEAIRSSRGLPGIAESLRHLHEPGEEAVFEEFLDFKTPWHRRLIYEELFILQLMVLQRKTVTDSALTISPESSRPGPLAKKMFPFKLTGAQSTVLDVIFKDLQTPQPMHRLVQGDVGSGKTAVALVAAASVASSGYQVAFMAPTELLAEQHSKEALKILPLLGLRVALLTGSMSQVERREVLGGLESGNVQVVIGTHALIQESVVFRQLGLAIVDEQHRFGVLQRAQLLKMGTDDFGNIPHMMVMTATPIPRTLALTVYGDLDTSVIDELPPGRKPVLTNVFRERERKRVYENVAESLRAGRQAYVVLPLVTESDKEGVVDLRDAVSTAEELSGGWLHEFEVGLLHGKMTSDEKDRAMRRFSQNEIQVLVATTVVEVGIDVPNSTSIVVEHAERFGLSQLHQLRGRVGRGKHQSHCYLVTKGKQTEDALRRLAIMEKTNDGFKVAEEDLAIRGPGDFLGTRQAGLPMLTIANLARDAKILEEARLDAQGILGTNPKLKGAEFVEIRRLLTVLQSFSVTPVHVA
ncbi:MAG: ATP-dependent DNA helicase RecG [Myxococcota bacterium]|nr:ATP-dependent DNA helicase RecG [Myxococcota bacterium]